MRYLATTSHSTRCLSSHLASQVEMPARSSQPLADPLLAVLICTRRPYDGSAHRTACHAHIESSPLKMPILRHPQHWHL